MAEISNSTSEVRESVFVLAKKIVSRMAIALHVSRSISSVIRCSINEKAYNKCQNRGKEIINSRAVKPFGQFSSKFTPFIVY